MTQEKGEQRYFPNKEELQILIPNLIEYFKLRERSNERKDMVNKTYELVKDLNPGHWTAGKVRLWFNNNKSVYLGKDQRRVPTPIIPPSKLADPNADIEIEKTSTPIDAPVGEPVEVPIDIPNTMQHSIPLIPQSQHSETNNILSDSKPYVDTTPIGDAQSSNSFSLISPTNSSILKPIFSPFSPTNSFSMSLPPLSTSTFNDLEEPIHQEEPQVKINFPDLQDVNDDLDAQKFRLYESLRQMYAAVIDIGELDPKNRLECQRKLEERMTQIFKHAREVQHINDICTNDNKCKRINTPSSNKNIQRQYSVITSSYANDESQNTNNIKYEEVGENSSVFIPVNITRKFKEPLTHNLICTLKGECEKIEAIEPNGTIECSSISETGDVAYVYKDDLKHAYMLHFKDSDVPTGFFMRPSSIFVDDNSSQIFVAGDCRIKSYSIPDLTPIETFQVSSSDTIIQSCLAVSHRTDGSFLIFGTKGLILMWDVSFVKPKHQSSIKKSTYKAIAENQSLDLSLIDWSLGRASEFSFKPDACIEEVTSLCPLGNCIAFASKKHHAIHLLDKDRQEVIGILVGHSKGIKRLVRLDAKTLLSASKDFTLKIWDVEQMIPTYHLIRHAATVTSVTAGTYESDLLIFSGSKDGIVHTWDVPKRLSTFEIRLSNINPNEDFIPTEMKYNPQKNKLIIVSTKKIMNYIFKHD